MIDSYNIDYRELKRKVNDLVGSLKNSNTLEIITHWFKWKHQRFKL